jgi:hypothetical protein
MRLAVQRGQRAELAYESIAADEGGDVVDGEMQVSAIEGSFIDLRR